MNHTDSPEQI